MEWSALVNMYGVYKAYPGNVEALRGVNLNIDKGDFVFIVGPSAQGSPHFYQ